MPLALTYEGLKDEEEDKPCVALSVTGGERGGRAVVVKTPDGNELRVEGPPASASASASAVAGGMMVMVMSGVRCVAWRCVARGCGLPDQGIACVAS